MTLGDFFNVLSKDPSIIIFYNVAVPTTALLSLYFGKGYGHVSPWKYLYTTLIYLACIPGIFAISLSLYVFLFERRSILDANIYVHILPVLSMIFTLWLIRQNVRLRDIPGFKSLGDLILMISIILGLLWLLEKTQIWVITFLPFYQFILLIVCLIVLIRFLWIKVTG